MSTFLLSLLLSISFRPPRRRITHFCNSSNPTFSIRKCSRNSGWCLRYFPTRSDVISNKNIDKFDNKNRLKVKYYHHLFLPFYINRLIVNFHSLFKVRDLFLSDFWCCSFDTLYLNNLNFCPLSVSRCTLCCNFN